MEMFTKLRLSNMNKLNEEVLHLAWCGLADTYLYLCLDKKLVIVNWCDKFPPQAKGGMVTWWRARIHLFTRSHIKYPASDVATFRILSRFLNYSSAWPSSCVKGRCNYLGWNWNVCPIFAVESLMKWAISCEGRPAGHDSRRSTWAATSYHDGTSPLHNLKLV